MAAYISGKEKTMEEQNLEFEKVAPSEFFIELAGRKRQVKFGNLALAKVEKKYGSTENFDKLQEDIETKPMETIPWLIGICLKDKEGLNVDNAEEILEAMDDSNLNIKDVMEVIAAAMNNSFSNMMGGGEKKTVK